VERERWPYIRLLAPDYSRLNFLPSRPVFCGAAKKTLKKAKKLEATKPLARIEN
jgi:hypothetical protein